jgi:Ca2+-binding EF-hand superfamily protein
MRAISLLSAVLLLATSSAISMASPEALKALDSDRDGAIDLPEAQAGATKVFATLDPDKDGTLDATELDGRLNTTALKAADPDNDGTLDTKEYADLVEARFRVADPDEDGTINSNELPSSYGAELLTLIYE